MTRASAPLDTTEWELHAFVDWRPKQRSIECPCCHGKRTVGGGFKDIDGARQCPECHGTGHKLVGPTSPKPETPPALIEHMRRAWWDYFHATPGDTP